MYRKLLKEGNSPKTRMKLLEKKPHCPTFFKEQLPVSAIVLNSGRKKKEGTDLITVPNYHQ